MLASERAHSSRLRTLESQEKESRSRLEYEKLLSERGRLDAEAREAEESIRSLTSAVASARNEVQTIRAVREQAHIAAAATESRLRDAQLSSQHCRDVEFYDMQETSLEADALAQQIESLTQRITALSHQRRREELARHSLEQRARTLTKLKDDATEVLSAVMAVNEALVEENVTSSLDQLPLPPPPHYIVGARMHSPQRVRLATKAAKRGEISLGELYQQVSGRKTVDHEGEQEESKEHKGAQNKFFPDDGHDLHRWASRDERTKSISPKRKHVAVKSAHCSRREGPMGDLYMHLNALEVQLLAEQSNLTEAYHDIVQSVRSGSYSHANDATTRRMRGAIAALRAKSSALSHVSCSLEALARLACPTRNINADRRKVAAMNTLDAYLHSSC
jgi:hypothetical protein